MFKINQLRGASLLTFGALIMGAMLNLTGCDNKDKTPQAPPPPNVNVIKLEPRDVTTFVELPGRASAYYHAEVRPQVSGIILKRMFDEGSYVEAGQQLYQIDPAIYEANYQTALANQQKAQANLVNAQLTAERYEQVVKVNAVSKQEYDNAMAQLRAAKAEVAAANAAVKTAKVNLDYTKVYSPVSGKAGISTVTEGALVTAAQATPLVYVQQVDRMYIDIVQSSTDYLRLQRSIQDGSIKNDGTNGIRNVRLIFEDGTSYKEMAVLKLNDTTVDKSTGSITRRAVVKNEDGMILPGMYIRAQVKEGLNQGALLVPDQAVQRGNKGEYIVLVVNKDNVVEQRVIQSDRSYNKHWVVIPGVKDGTGLDAGDMIIMEGSLQVRHGLKVNPTIMKHEPVLSPDDEVTKLPPEAIKEASAADVELKPVGSGDQTAQ